MNLLLTASAYVFWIVCWRVVRRQGLDDLQMLCSLIVLITLYCVCWLAGRKE